ncbi:MAG: glycosyltransferase family 9 protein [Desulfatitalea sp.]
MLIQLGDIGDVVLSLPCVRALKDNFPKAQVVVAVRSKARELIEICPWADDVISIEQPQLGIMATIGYHIAFFRRLGTFRFDLVLDLRAGTRGAVLARFSGAAIRVGFYSTKEPFWRNLAFTHLKPFMPDPNCHQSMFYQNLLTECGIDILHRLPKIVVPTEFTQQARQLLSRHNVDSNKQIIAVHPFALWRYKEWPLQKTTELVQRLTTGTHRTTLIIGAPSERERAQSIVDQCNGQAVNLAGETGLSMLAAIIQQCMLLIGMDSALGHISAAVSTPCVIIFGPGKPGVWAPLGELSRIVYKDLPCIYCGQKGCDGHGQSLCLEQLSVEEVLLTIERHIDRLNSTDSEDLKRTASIGG